MPSIHGRYFQLHLFTFTLAQLLESLLLDVHFDLLLLLIFYLEYVLLVVLAASPTHEDLVLGGSGLGLCYFREDEGLSRLFAGVVDRVYHLLRVHSL